MAILSFAAMNVMGVRDAAVVSNIFAVGKVLPLLLFMAVGLIFVDPQSFSVAVQPSYGALSMSVLL